MTTTGQTVARISSRVGLIALAYVAFISLGLPDGLLGVAWPSIRADFGRPLDSLGLILFAGTTGYLTSSFFSGRIMARLGVGRLLALSCALTGASLLGYTQAPNFWVFVTLAVTTGLGAGAIDAGLNTYIAAHHGEGLMQWLHASFGVGITLGPMIMTAGLRLTENWRTGYLLVGAAQVTLALLFFLTARQWQNGPAAAAASKPRLTDYQTALRSTLSKPRVWLSLLLFFLYTGMEVSLGIWAYSLLTEARGVEPALAGLLAGSYWGMFTVGRVIAGLWARRVEMAAVLPAAMGLALVGTILLAVNLSPALSIVGLTLAGFAIAPIFPGLVSTTEGRVGAAHAANTIGMQISAAGLGAFAVPALAGVIARQTTLNAVPVFVAGLTVVMIVVFAATQRRLGEQG